jgi:Domain of unknown function (DUF4383)
MVRRPQLMAVQGAALLVGIAFLAVGVLGFLPGVTTDHAALQWAGHHSHARLFGTFATSGLHNVVHLVLGMVGLWSTRTFAASRAYLLAGGLLFIGLWIYSMVPGHALPFFPLNGADNWLHFGIGVVMVLLGLTLGATHDPTKRRFRARTSGRAT